MHDHDHDKDQLMIADADTEHDRAREQLSAWLDGELPEAEARFLLRRLEHDLALRQVWARMQLAASCLRNHPLRPMSPGLPARVSAAMAADGAHGASARAPRRWHWAAAASVAALAVLLAPRFGADHGPDLAAITQPRMVPSLAAADLVTRQANMTAAVVRPGAAAPTAAAAMPAGVQRASLLTDISRAPAPAALQESPMPLDMQSPADFPLAQTGEKRWPRSQLAIEGNDPALEAYLVRHNQMIANDGLSGFVPYVDVVSSGSSADAAAPLQGNDSP